MTRETVAIIICAPIRHKLGLKMNQLLDFLPIAIFAAVFFSTPSPDNIYYATAALMAGVTLQLVAYWLMKKPIGGPLKFTFWASVVMGALTLFLRDATFIQWKPTIVNWVFTIALLVAPVVAKTNLLKKVLGAQLQLPDDVWRRLNYGWALGFFVAGALNLLVAYNFSMEFWVSYKLVGGFALTFVYIIATVIYLNRLGLITEPENAQEPESAEDRV